MASINCKHEWVFFNPQIDERKLLILLYGNVEQCKVCKRLRVNNADEEPYLLKVVEGKKVAKI